jgi:hypothetical protein
MNGELETFVVFCRVVTSLSVYRTSNLNSSHMLTKGIQSESRSWLIVKIYNSQIVGPTLYSNRFILRNGSIFDLPFHVDQQVSSGVCH